MRAWSAFRERGRRGGVGGRGRRGGRDGERNGRRWEEMGAGMEREGWEGEGG